MSAETVFGWNMLIAMGALALVGGMLSGKSWGVRFFNVLIAALMLSLGWLMVGGIAYIGVNLVADGIEKTWEGIEFSAAGRMALAKWMAFAGLTLFYARHVWEEMRTPAHLAGPRLVVGAARPGRNLPSIR